MASFSRWVGGLCASTYCRARASSGFAALITSPSLIVVAIFAVTRTGFVVRLFVGVSTPDNLSNTAEVSAKG